MINETGVFLVVLIGALIIWLVWMDVLERRRDAKRREGRRIVPQAVAKGEQISGVNFADYGTHMITRDASRREVVSAIRGATAWRMHCNSCGRGWSIYDTDRDRARRACLDHTRTCLQRTTNTDEKAAATP